MDGLYYILEQLVPVIIVLFLIFLGNSYFKKKEKKDWNNGTCPKCGEPWKFDSYEGGDRVYVCKNDHFLFITYHIDK